MSFCLSSRHDVANVTDPSIVPSQLHHRTNTEQGLRLFVANPCRQSTQVRACTGDHLRRHSRPILRFEEAVRARWTSAVDFVRGVPACLPACLFARNRLLPYAQQLVNQEHDDDAGVVGWCVDGSAHCPG